jgi:hypothetical protein
VSPQELNSAQQAVDEIVAAWPDVRAKQVFGHRGYVRSGKMFGFHAGQGVAVRTFAQSEAEALYAREGVVPFVYNESMEMRGWPLLPLRSDAEITFALTALQEAYARAV